MGDNRQNLREQERQKLLSDFRKRLQSLNRSPATITNCVHEVGLFFRFLDQHGIQDLARVGWQDIEAFLSDLLNKRQWQEGSVQVAFYCVKGFFRYLAQKKIIKSNPAASVEPPKVGNLLPRNVPSEEEMANLLNQPDTNRAIGIRDRAILETFYSSGIRISELVHLNLDDVDTAKGVLHIRNGKGGKDREAIIGNSACLWLRMYLRLVRRKWAGRNSGDAFFLGVRRHNRIHAIVVRLMVTAHARNAGIKKHITPHSLRHATGTHLCRNGADILCVQKVLGHELATTTQRYVRLVQDDVRKMLKKFHPREIHGNGGEHH